MFLYKYLTKQKATDWLIGKEAILLTPALYLNDVLEFRVRRERADDEELRAMYDRFHEEAPSANTFEQWKERVTSEGFRYREHEDMRNYLSGVFGVISLTAHPLSELMWAHYCLNSGVAVGYKAADETGQDGMTARFLPFGVEVTFQVSYEDSVPPVSKDFSNVSHVLTRKRKCWEYEAEWRMIQKLADATKHPDGRKTYYSVPARRDAIKHVIFGVNADADFKSKMVEWLGDSSAHVQCVAIDPDSLTFRLDDYQP